MSCCAKSMTSVAAPMWTAIEMRMAWSERNDRAPRYPKDCVPKPAADCPLVAGPKIKEVMMEMGQYYAAPPDPAAATVMWQLPKA